MKSKITAMFAVATLLAVGAAIATDASSTTGEVLEIQRGVSVSNQGELDRLTIRTRNGETQRLLMGRSGSCPDCVMVGDRVRARVMAGDESATAQRVRSMKVRRTGQTIPFRNEAGELIRERTRNGAGSGVGAANGHGGNRNQRMHQFGTRGGNRAGARSCGGGRRQP